MSGSGVGLVAASAVLVLGLRAWTAVAPPRTGGVPIATPRFRRRRQRERTPTELDVAAWCDDLARAVRSGSSLATAVRECESHSGIVAIVGPVAARLSRGQSLSESLRAVPTDPSRALGLALTVLRWCADLGGPAASPLERVAATLRERDAIRQEQRSHSAQARMSARVLTLVPIGMLALLALTDPNVRAAIGTPPGVAAVTTGAVLNGSGWWWMQRVIGRSS